MKNKTGISLSTLFFVCVQLVFAQHQKSTFTDVTIASGITFRYNFGDRTYENILESSGSGITVFDYNNDGYMDIYMLNGTYLEGISDETGKIYNYGPNVFYRNNGDGTFTDVAGNLGLTGPDKLNGFTKWSVGVAFWDIDQDGRTDLMLGNFLAFDPNYVSPTMPDMMPHPSEYTGQASLFYKQKPDGTFEEITESLGFYYPKSMCMGLTVFDYDHDGDLDLFQGNDHQANFIFRNDGNLKFTEVAVASGVAVNDLGQVTGSMHGSIGDIDGDGLIDLLVTDLKYGALYRNRGNGLFEDITRKSGVADVFLGKGEWAAQLFDYDNDGDLDIFSANGTAEELKLQLPLLLENDGKGNFTNMGAKAGTYFAEKRSGRAAAVIDYDNDGDLDLMISHIDLKATPSLLKNEGNDNHWLGITLEGNKDPASAIGTMVKVKTGNKTQTLVNQPANAYLSWNDPRMHVGLGKSAIIDQLEIIWPQGKKEVYTNIKANQYLKIIQGKGIE